jgi:hypothetical protein
MVFLAFSAAWCLLAGTGGTPSHGRSFGIKTLAGYPAMSLRNKDLEVKSLLFFDLEPLPLPVGAPGSPLLLRPGVGPPFRPDHKVKLDKREATSISLR